MTSAKNSCSVCSEPLEVHTEAFCNSCGQPYHLNQRTDLPGRDCGEVWIHEEHLSLEFACFTCLHPEPPGTASIDDILDIAEAAMLANVNEPALAALAEAGALRHRRTSSGTYLFERRDVILFLEGRR